jgi:hypothetical protein
MQWQPIETAPKDGTRIMLFWPVSGWTDFGWWKDNPRLIGIEDIDGIPVKAEYFSNSMEWDDYELAKVGNEPSHWMPLPEPPSGEHSASVLKEEQPARRE